MLVFCYFFLFPSFCCLPVSYFHSSARDGWSLLYHHRTLVVIVDGPGFSMSHNLNKTRVGLCTNKSLQYVGKPAGVPAR
ncbi:hypothetical protein M426DRAFT_231078 [Hypoxylon sp. CI-4A]|nr:hypothetical protein M426DRAFT_231078 [Hypoxylon sp. CI-4A]